VHAFQEAANVELRNTGLEWTRFSVGYFLDYYGMPYIKTNLRPLTFVVDMANKTAAIPGTGNDPMAFTYSLDVAKFVEAALDLPEWEETTFCYGEKTTWNSFVRMAEEARGRRTCGSRFHRMIGYDF
jgi:nucleoside-diphosphate-sugar epimerase